MLIRLLLALCFSLPGLAGADKIQLNGTRIFCEQPEGFVLSGWKNYLLSGKYDVWVYFQDVGIPEDVSTYARSLAHVSQEKPVERHDHGFQIFEFDDAKHQTILAFKKTDETTWLIRFHANKYNVISKIVDQVLDTAEYRPGSSPFEGHGGVPYTIDDLGRFKYFGIIHESLFYLPPGTSLASTPCWFQIDRSGFWRNRLPPDLEKRTLQSLVVKGFPFGQCPVGPDDSEVIESGERTIEVHHFEPEGCAVKAVWVFIILPEGRHSMPVKLTFVIREADAISKAEMVRIARSYHPVPERWNSPVDPN